MRVAEVQCLNELNYRLHSTMSIECLAWDEGRIENDFPQNHVIQAVCF